MALTNPPDPLPTSSSAVAPVTKHLAYLDGVRAVAAIFVVIHHIWAMVFGFGRHPLHGFSKVLNVFEFGRSAVALFIVLSGFCLMLPIIKGDGTLRGGALEFFKRRARRILPTYYAALALSLLLTSTLINHKVGTFWDQTYPITFKSLVTHVFMVHDAFQEIFTIDGPCWSVAVEWRIYFLFPLLLWSWRRYGPWTTMLASIALSTISFAVLSIYIQHGLTAFYVGLFALGMMSAAIAYANQPTFDLWRRKCPWGTVAFLLLLLTLWVNFRPIPLGYLPGRYVSEMVAGLWAVAFLVWASNERSWGHRILSLPSLAFLGTFAYSIYLIHLPLLQLLWQYPFASLHKTPLLLFTMMTCIGTPIVLAASYLFFLLFERPFLRKRPLVRPQAIVVNTVLEPAS